MPLGISGVSIPDQVNVSAFCRAADPNMQRQKLALPSCPSVPPSTDDSRRTGLESATHMRAGGSIFCRAKRPVSVEITGFWLLAALPFPDFLGELSQPSVSSAAARRSMPALVIVILMIVDEGSNLFRCRKEMHCGEIGNRVIATWDWVNE